MDIDYWKKYYDKHNTPFEPSSFSKFIMKYVDEGEAILDLGCGNGRDTIFFSKNGLHAVGIDQCENIINELRKDYGSRMLEFGIDDFTNLHWDDTFIDHAYSRFTLHSVDEDSEDRVISWAKDHVSSYFFIEVRSDRDSLVGQSTDHYRRFVNFEKLLMKLINADFCITYAEMARGFSEYESKFGVDYNEDDPMLIRIVCKKKR